MISLGVRALVDLGEDYESWHHCRIVGVWRDPGLHGHHVLSCRVVGGGVFDVMYRRVRIVCGHCSGCRSLNAGTDCMRPMAAGDVDDLLIG